MRAIRSVGAWTLLVAGLSGCELAAAMDPGNQAEQVLVAPPGWTFDSQAFSATATAAAAVAYRYKSGDPQDIYEASLIVQSRPDGAVVTTEMPRKVFWVALSPNGDHLLVAQTADPQACGGPFWVHLIDSDGRVLWSKYDSRSFFFSPSGERVFACWTPDWSPDGGRDVELYDLAGESLGVVSLDQSLRGVVVGQLVPPHRTDTSEWALVSAGRTFFFSPYEVRVRSAR